MIEWFASSTLMLLSLWLLLAVVIRAAYPLLRLVISRVSAAQGAALLLLYLSLPFISSAWLVLSLYWPDVAQWLVVEHCHSGLCAPHGPVSALAIWPACVLGAWFFLRLLNTWRSLYLPARKLLKQLNLVGSVKSGFIELPEDSVAAFTVGVFNSKIFLSRGLLASCSNRDVQIIIAHEQAHQYRLDNLRRILIGLLIAPVPSRLTKPMVEDHQLLCEQACDEQAAQLGSREDVAETVLKIARLQTPPSVYVSAFADTHIRLRIEALLAKPGVAMPKVLVYAGSYLALGLFLALVDPLHHLLERLH